MSLENLKLNLAKINVEIDEENTRRFPREEKLVELKTIKVAILQSISKEMETLRKEAEAENEEIKMLLEKVRKEQKK